MRLLNFLIEKRVTFMGLLLLFVCVTFVSGSMEFRAAYDGRPTTLPYISGFDDNTLLKRTEITTDKVEWPRGRQIRVGIFARAFGVGVGEGTLTNLNVLDKATKFSDRRIQSQPINSNLKNYQLRILGHTNDD